MCVWWVEMRGGEGGKGRGVCVWGGGGGGARDEVCVGGGGRGGGGGNKVLTLLQQHYALVPVTSLFSKTHGFSTCSYRVLSK